MSSSESGERREWDELIGEAAAAAGEVRNHCRRGSGGTIGKWQLS